MNFFGWFTVLLWALVACSPADIKPNGLRYFAVIMVVSTLVWGTGTGI